MSAGPVVYEPSGPVPDVRSARPSTPPRGGPTDRTLRDLATRLRDLQPVPKAPARAGAALFLSTKPREPTREAADAAQCEAARRDGEGQRVGSLPLISHSSAPAGAEPDRTRVAQGGAAGPSDPAVSPSRAVAYSLSPSIHAREVRALASGQLGAGLWKDPLTGPELAPATVVRAFCCGQEIFVGTVRRGVPESSGHGTFSDPRDHSFCRICESRGPFTVRLLRPGQTRLVGV